MQDVGYWEKHGVRCVAVTTTAFLRQASQQLVDLGLDGLSFACVPHPVQGLSKLEIEMRLNGIVQDLLSALQDDEYKSPSAAGQEATVTNGAVPVAECGS